MKIRQAEVKDATPISALILPALTQHVLPTIAPEARDMLQGTMTADCIKTYLQTGHRYHVAESAQGELVGVIGMRDNVHLLHLFIHDAHHGMGISRQLWETAKAECLRHGNQGKFTVNAALNAEKVYLAFGFQRVEGIRNRNGMLDIPMVLEYAV
ncbi:GNAT family N-acetyltransferase [Photobacterium sp. GJ3]|uniref:GNAT family N-acetyltransferase n=1 Tax=Photobacterium sp. GJ3 TaxID=2829502 RepID=UPI001B8AE1B8|nr:GNAT family N-acetyltransferase [Photobacterium sp. GJ3]QUJ66505.1 GNAT family N-acetyltransferase [Photobacterium sp. GJ3]